MPYNKTNWTEMTPINTTNLQKIEDGIEAVETEVAAHKGEDANNGDDPHGVVSWVKSFGLGSSSMDITGTDLNTIVKTGFYSGYNLVNNPSGSHTTGYLIHTEYRASGYAFQIYSAMESARKTYYRQKNDGVWDSWILMMDNTGFDGLKQSVSNGKIDVRNAITGNGGTVADADGDGIPTFQELADGVATASPTPETYYDPSWYEYVNSDGSAVISLGTGYRTYYVKGGWNYFYLHNKDVPGKFEIRDLGGALIRTVNLPNPADVLIDDFHVYPLDDGNDLVLFKATIGGLTKVMGYDYNSNTLRTIYEESNGAYMSCDMRNGDIYLCIGEGDYNFHIKHYSITGLLKKTSASQGKSVGNSNWHPKDIAYDHTKERLVMWGWSSADTNNYNNDLLEWDIYANTLTPLGIFGLSNQTPNPGDSMFFDDYGRLHFFAGRYFYNRVRFDTNKVYEYRVGYDDVNGKGQFNRNGDAIFSVADNSDNGYLMTWSGKDDELSPSYSRRGQVNSGSYWYNWWQSAGLNMQGRGMAYSNGQAGNEGVYAGMSCRSYAYMPVNGEYLIAVKDMTNDIAYINTITTDLFDYNNFVRINSGDKVNILGGTGGHKIKGTFVGRFVFLKI